MTPTAKENEMLSSELTPAAQKADQLGRLAGEYFSTCEKSEKKESTELISKELEPLWQNPKELIAVAKHLERIGQSKDDGLPKIEITLSSDGQVDDIDFSSKTYPGKGRIHSDGRSGTRTIKSGLEMAKNVVTLARKYMDLPESKPFEMQETYQSLQDALREVRKSDFKAKQEFASSLKRICGSWLSTEPNFEYSMGVLKFTPAKFDLQRRRNVELLSGDVGLYTPVSFLHKLKNAVLEA